MVAQEEEQQQQDASLVEWKKKREEKRRQREVNSKKEDDLLLMTAAEEKGGEKERARNVDENLQEEEEEEEEMPMIPLAKRRRMEQDQFLQESMRKGGRAGRKQRELMESLQGKSVAEKTNVGKTKTLAFEATNKNTNDDDDHQQQQQQQEGEGDSAPVESLLERAAALQQNRTEEEKKQDKRKEEEERILRESSKVQSNALQGASELAHGVIYKDPMPSSWTVPRYILEQGEPAWLKIRKEWHMEVEGETVPPPMKRFSDMKLPPPILKSLNAKGIKRPTPIQMQGLPVALASRDMVGIAFTGSGKTLTFSLPMVMAALEEELRMPLIAGEGPVAIVMAPSRELARQTYDVVHEFCTTISDTPQYPQLRAQLFIGGESVRDQLQMVQQQGVHCIVATPGRLRDILKRKAMTLDICRFICLDEADRMLDLGFDEEVGEIMNYFRHQRQTLLFSATFPQKFQQFAKQTLVQPIVVNVGRAGAANLDVIQEVEYVKQEAKIVYLLHCLQKTSPPVVIFCERKGDVDDIHEYLLLKGVEAVSIHGGKDQEERNEAIAMYKAGQKDVLGRFCVFAGFYVTIVAVVTLFTFTVANTF